MQILSATDVAIAIAVKNGTLRVVDRVSPRGLGAFVAIEDDRGVIEVANSRAAATARVNACGPQRSSERIKT